MPKILRLILDFILDSIETVVVSLAFFIIIYLFLFQPHQVKGNSMSTSLKKSFYNGEYLLTNKISYRFNLPKRGDVIIFKAPQNENYDYIKRIIALPGETIKTKNGKVFINAKPLKESAYLPPTTYTKGGIFLKDEEEITIPQNKYFVMGDNRNFSSDSRDWGLVPKKNIIGKAWFCYWPPKKIGFLN